tara:strand:- start:2406 stop:2756 length:351 start_codon:yes stop_codon:yes gene_type:complete
MIQPTINRATHFSIVWAVILAVLTIVEWNSLDRDPMSEQIFLPFIEREITLQLTDPNTTEWLGKDADDLLADNVRRELETHVEIAFNGPLFLAYFFGPVLIFHAFGLLWTQLRRGS